MRYFSIILVLLFAASLGHAAETAPAIAVVHTWGELMATKLLTVVSEQGDLGGPASGKVASITVQVGIDRDHATSRGAVVLYCLARGQSFSPQSEGDLGPFLVRVHDSTKAADLEQVAPVLSSLSGSGYLLSTHAVALGDPGKVVIELILPNSRSAQPKIVAQADVEVSGKPVLPWSPWGQSKLEQRRWAQGGNIPGMTETYTTVTISNPVGGIAIPRTQSSIVYPTAPAAGSPLPQLIPEKPDSDTHLKMVENSLIVTMSREVEIYFPDDHFLTRWWLNGKAVAPDPNSVDPPHSRNLAARVWDVKEVRFELDFHPERLGAKKGDKIGVQVLFCPEGWDLAGPLESSAMAMLNARNRDATVPPATFSYPSNAIDFVYSGDPKNVQQK